MKYTLQTAVLRLSLVGLIRLMIKRLSAALRFRTPLKLKELKNLTKQNESSHPKAGFGTGKIRIGRLGAETGLSSYFYPVRWSNWISIQKSKMEEFRAVLCGMSLQPVGASCFAKTESEIL